MRRLFAVAILALLWPSNVSGGNAPPARIVNLNNHNTLAAIQHSNPTHYEKIQKILEAVFEQPDTDARWLQTNFDAQNVSYAPILLTSAPPKRRLSFVIDNIRYNAVITITAGQGQVLPVN